MDLAVLTNTARARMAQAVITGKGFRITHFEIGNQGHDPEDREVAQSPDPGITETPGLIFGPEPVDERGYLSSTAPYWKCVLERGECTTPLLSSIVLIATITDNGTDPVDEVGVTFPYAVLNMLARPKTSGERLEFTVGLIIP